MAESLRGDPVLGKYEKIVRLTHAPLERVVRNMQDDGIPDADIARFEAAFGEGGGADPATEALMGDLERLGQEKEYRDGLQDMEKRIIEKMTDVIAAHEARIMAAISGHAAAAAAAVPPPAVAVSAPPPPPPAADEAPAPHHSKIGRAFREPASSRRGGTKSSEPEIITSTLANPDKKQWVAIPGIKSTSGVQCESSCKEGYNKVRLDRSGIRWVIFEFDKTMEWIYPTREGVQTEDYVADWDNFVQNLPDKKACYALYNFEYEDQGGSGYAMAGHNVVKNKMVLFAWTDSKCKVRDRMVAASSQSAIKQVCKGSCDCAVHDKADMTYLMICKELDCNVAGA